MPQLPDITKPMPEALLQTISADLFDDAACRSWLLHYLHAGGSTCPECRQEITSERQLDSFRSGKRVCCKACGRWFDQRTGTVIACTTLGPRRILLLALLIAAGLTTREIGDRLQLHESTVRDWRDRLSHTGLSVLRE